MKVKDINWKTYQFKESAVLSFVVMGNKILLIRKKSGLGKGKINAPGGRIETGETPLNAAIRESEEEIGVTPINPIAKGELFFIFTNGYSLHCHVFLADEYWGTPYSTIEADPHWFDLKDIPYNEMWQDDAHWLPLVLDGKNFKGFFTFNEDDMIDKKIDLI